jgi:hypothetical protein
MMELEAELQTLLTFVKSGYTNATHQESEWMQVCVCVCVCVCVRVCVRARACCVCE